MMSDHEGKSPGRRISGPGDAGDDHQSPLLSNVPSKTAVSECLSSWLHYLQMLNGLCAAGNKLSQCLITLAQEPNIQFGLPQGSFYAPHPSLQITTQCLSGWDQLTRATIIATSTVKTHMVSALQQYMSLTLTMNNLNEQHEVEIQRIKENCHQIICDNVLSLVNLQYQFCIACSECLGTITTCPCCQTTSGHHDAECSMTTLQQCFSRLYAAQFNEPRSQTASPHSGSHPLNLSQGSLESPKTSIETGRILSYEPFHVRTNISAHEKSLDSPRTFPNPEYKQPFDRGQYFQSSGSSSDSPKSPYIHPDSFRHHYQSSDIYRGPSPTMLHQDYMRPGVEGVKCLEPRGPSPLSATHEAIRGPSPVQSFLDNIRGPGQIDSVRGPFPNPGILLSMKAPFVKTGRSPLHFPLFPLNGQRRWSEAAAAEMGGTHTDDGTMRRWSMPWDAGRGATGQATTVPFTPYGQHNVQGIRRLKQQPQTHYSHSSDRSRSTTPEWQCSIASGGAGSVTSQDGLVEAIQLLSLKPGVRPHYLHGPPAPNISGVAEVWSEEHKLFSSDDRYPKRYHMMHSRWPHTRHSDASATCGDIGVEGATSNIGNLTQQPGSSSDTSSSGSGLPSSSSRTSGGSSSSGSTGMGGLVTSTVIETNEPTDNVQAYSIWSGRDHLPFLRLPESQEFCEEESQTANKY